MVIKNKIGYQDPTAGESHCLYTNVIYSKLLNARCQIHKWEAVLWPSTHQRCVHKHTFGTYQVILTNIMGNICIF